jgi:hypothetical protein
LAALYTLLCGALWLSAQVFFLFGLATFFIAAATLLLIAIYVKFKFKNSLKQENCDKGKRFYRYLLNIQKLDYQF